MMIGASISPVIAARAPGMPAKRAPTQTATLQTFGPGKNWHRARTLIISSSVSHLRFSTIIQRAHGIAVPKPRSPAEPKPRNRSSGVMRRAECWPAGEAHPTRSGNSSMCGPRGEAGQELQDAVRRQIAETGGIRHDVVGAGLTKSRHQAIARLG